MRLDVVGGQEAAQILGVEVGRVSRWIESGRMPPMLSRPKATPVWKRSDVERLARDGEWKGKRPEREFELGEGPLLGLNEVALRLGVSKRQISRLRAARKMPEPSLDKRAAGSEWKPGAGLGATPLWEAEVIDRFLRERQQTAA